MSEMQLIKPLTPKLKISSMDSHRMLTHPAATPARAGTREPLRTNEGPTTANDIVMKPTPMDVTMVQGGVAVRRPPASVRAAAAQGARMKLSGGTASADLATFDASAKDAEITALRAMQLNPEQAALCAHVLEVQLHSTAAGVMPDDAAELVRTTLHVLRTIVEIG